MIDLRKIIREEIRKAMSPPPEVIDIDIEDGDNYVGNVYGVIHHDREHLNNWIEGERISADFNSIPDSELFPIGILKNINVEDDYKGQGRGNELFDRFIEEASHCSYITFIADTSEEQNKGFDLINWYKRKGFNIFGDSGGMPVMISKVEDIIGEIDLSVNMSPRAKPGPGRHFPEEKKGGSSLNLSVSDGPHQFPK
ncbi:MAG: hypothetical protein AABY15_05390 [Nanoarchaeota archaeon]